MKLSNYLFVFACSLSISTMLFSHPISPTNGMRETSPSSTAIVGAHIIVSPTESIEHGTVVIEDGTIVAVGEVDEVNIPDGTTIVIAEGLTLAPAFIESKLPVQVIQQQGSDGKHPNVRIHPEIHATSLPMPDGRMDTLRKTGFGAACILPDSGIASGSTACIPIDESQERRGAYVTTGPMTLRFDYGGSWGSASYPGALCGSVAVMRQTLYDSIWHAHNVDVANQGLAIPPMPSVAFVALKDVVEGNQSVLFDLKHESDVFRARDLANEFGFDYAFLGCGEEYRRTKEIARLGKPIVVPVNFPRRPDVSTQDKIDNLSLRTLMDWEQAPTNPKRLMNEGLPVAITMDGCNHGSEFLRNIQKSIDKGLSDEEALASLTTVPAEMMGLQERLGTITQGAYANIQLIDGDILDPDRILRDIWINGNRHRLERDRVPSGANSFALHIGDEMVEANIDQEKKRFSLADNEEQRITLRNTRINRDGITATMDATSIGQSGWGSLILVAVGDNLTGSLTLANGNRLAVWGEPIEEYNEEQTGTCYTGKLDVGSTKLDISIVIPAEEGSAAIFNIGSQDKTINEYSIDASTGKMSGWIESRDGSRREFAATLDGNEIQGTLTGEPTDSTLFLKLGDEPPEEFEDEQFVIEPLPVPFGSYGKLTPPSKQDIRFEHVTIWTCTEDGIIEDGCLIIRDGKIDFVGSMNEAPPTRFGENVFVAKGLHLTPGLIDCHSHTGLRGGVNEWTQANTAEVRMEDVIDPDDVDWYRQLAGGLTAANQLHGSANPIGGQNSVVSIRWGDASDAMHFPQAKSGIKFALGENVKRSSGRYPDTRMGVEAFIRDAFLAAQDYEDAWEEWNNTPEYTQHRTVMPRKDLELDTLVEILNGDRLIHCHSYRQDEILMLLRLAEELGFTIGTLQHVLEGYKVAEIIADHGAGASCFSDWWAYKEEVMDAIPHNGAIMHDVGAVVSFNSDSNDQARRMNTEAAKGVRWGDLSPEDALALVTINPAKQLHIDGDVGSLEKGKQADIAVWNGDPLATTSLCLQTWIEGARYFDLKEDELLREEALNERTRLIELALAAAYGDLVPPEQAAAPVEIAEEEYSCQHH